MTYIPPMAAPIGRPKRHIRLVPQPAPLQIPVPEPVKVPERVPVKQAA